MQGADKVTAEQIREIQTLLATAPAIGEGISLSTAAAENTGAIEAHALVAEGGTDETMGTASMQSDTASESSEDEVLDSEESGASADTKPFFLGRVQIELDVELPEVDFQRTAREVLAPEAFPALQAGGGMPWQPLDKIAGQLTDEQRRDLQLLSRPTAKLKKLVRALYGKTYYEERAARGDDVLDMLYPGKFGMIKCCHLGKLQSHVRAF